DAAGSGDDDGPGPPDRRGVAVRGHGQRAHDPHVGVAEGDVDREPHADRVHRPGGPQQDGAREALPAEQALRPGAVAVGDLEAREDLAVTQQPRHDDHDAERAPWGHSPGAWAHPPPVWRAIAATSTSWSCGSTP